MANINFIKKPKVSNWTLVAKLWPHKTKEGAYSGKFGVKTRDGDNLRETFDSITLKAGDPILVKPNINRREGKNDPEFLVYMLSGSVEK